MDGASQGAERTPPAKDGVRGVTLVELLACLAVIAVLAAWGAPAFATLTRDAARTREVNQFIQAVYLARSEAIKRNGVVSLCPTNDGATCTAASGWQIGWLVFVNDDRDSPAARDGDEQLLRVYEPWDSGHILSNRTTLSFRPFGQMGVTATVTFCDDRGSSAARAVIISQTGRPRVSSRNASGGALTCP
ncbi:MAG TPA: GspH/FimT family pseudopilin [Steroidobacteraceae bacterium]|nr:GspH/FimT family pseudopilin [Steroidobacteraceae bacterium]